MASFEEVQWVFDRSVDQKLKKEYHRCHHLWSMSNPWSNLGSNVSNSAVDVDVECNCSGRLLMVVRKRSRHFWLRKILRKIWTKRIPLSMVWFSFSDNNSKITSPMHQKLFNDWCNKIKTMELKDYCQKMLTDRLSKKKKRSRHLITSQVMNFFCVTFKKFYVELFTKFCIKELVKVKSVGLQTSGCKSLFNLHSHSKSRVHSVHHIFNKVDSVDWRYC